jgi:hypothetical protein
MCETRCGSPFLRRARALQTPASGHSPWEPCDSLLCAGGRIDFRALEKPLHAQIQGTVQFRGGDVRIGGCERREWADSCLGDQ